MSYPSVVNALSPLAYYRLGESSGTVGADETGAYDGAYAGSPTLGATGLLVGDSDTAVDFSGTVKTGLNFTAPLNKDLYSISMIINMVSTPSSYTPVIFSFGDASKYISLFVSSSNIRVAHYSPSLSGNISKLITLGQTYHVIITYDGSTLTMYVDGVNVGTSIPTAFSTLTQSGTIGDFVSTTRKNFTGIVDEVAIFNTVLTPVQVTDLYNASITAPVVQQLVINGTITENLAASTWYARAYDLLTGELQGSATSGVGAFQIPLPITQTDKNHFVTVLPEQGTDWQASTVYSLDDLVLPTDLFSTPYYFVCTTAGTSDSTEPTWNPSIGVSTTDGTAVWEMQEGLIAPITHSPLKGELV